MRRRGRGVALLGAGLGLVAIEFVLRGRTSIEDQVAGQLVAFAVYLVAAALVWRGIGLGRIGLVLVLLVAVGLRTAAFQAGSPPPLSTDSNRYAWDARVEASGINPYRYAPTAAALARLRDGRIYPAINERDLHTIYPPGAEGAFLAARGVFGHGLRASTWLFLLAEGGTVALLLLVLRRAGAPLERVAVYAWHPLAISEIAGNGHVDALAVVALAGFLAAWQARRFTLAGAALALATLVKLGPALLVPVLARRGGRRLAFAAAAVVALGYLPFLSVGPRVVGSVFVLAQHRQFGSLLPLLAPLVGRSAAIALLLSGLAVLVLLVGLREHETLPQVTRSCLLVLGSLLLVSTLLEPWYALWLLPLLVVVAAPGWLLLTGLLPLLYLNGIHDRLPGWVPAALYLPLLAFALARGLARRRALELSPLRPGASVAAVVPVLDEEEALPGLLAELAAASVDEVIVVDGGSRDRTVEIATAAGARVIVERRRGYGRACATGAAATRADVIAFLDGDGSDDPACLAAVLEPVLAGRAALALGARRAVDPGALMPHQQLGNRLVAALLRLVYGLRLHDIPPMRAVRRDALEQLGMREMTYGWPTEMIVKAARARLPLVEVEVSARARRGGRSKIAGRAWPSLRAGALMLAVVARHA